MFEARTFPPRLEEKPSVEKKQKKTSVSLFSHLAPTSFPQIYLLVHSQLWLCVPPSFSIHLDAALCPPPLLLDGAAGSGQQAVQDADKRPIEGVQRQPSSTTWDHIVKFLQHFFFCVCESCCVHTQKALRPFPHCAQRLGVAAVASNLIRRRTKPASYCLLCESSRTDRT